MEIDTSIPQDYHLNFLENFPVGEKREFASYVIVEIYDDPDFRFVFPKQMAILAGYTIKNSPIATAIPVSKFLNNLVDYIHLQISDGYRFREWNYQLDDLATMAIDFVEFLEDRSTSIQKS